MLVELQSAVVSNEHPRKNNIHKAQGYALNFDVKTTICNIAVRNHERRPTEAQTHK